MPLIANPTDVPVTDFRQVHAGAYWHWNSLTRAATNRRLFDGDFSSLVAGRSKSARNGLELILDDADFVPTNWFKAITRFIIDAALAERPELQSDSSARADFMADNAERVFEPIEEALEQRSHGGHFNVTVTSDGYVEAPPAYAYIPLYGNPASRRPTGHMLSYRYAAGSETRARAMVAPMADRVDITKWTPSTDTTKWTPGAGVVESYGLGADNTLRGEPISRPSNIVGWWHFGDGCDDYSQIAGLVGAGMVLQTLSLQGINRHLEPQFTGPGAGLALLTPRNRAAYEKFQAMGGYLPTEGNDAPYEYVSADINMTDALDLLRWITDQVYLLTGIPRGLLGFEMSGVALDRLMFPAMSRLRTLRRHLERILAEIFDALGAPPGSTDAQWIADPFATLAERAGAVRDDYTASISTRREARVGRGYPEEVPDEEGENDATEETEVEEAEPEVAALMDRIRVRRAA